VPLTFKNPADYEKIEQGDALEIADFRDAIAKGGAVTLVDATKKITIECDAALSERQRAIVVAGGLLNYTNKGQG
jgi:aconitate hydratase